MNTYRISVTVLILALLALTLTGGPGLAQGPRSEAQSAVLGTAFTYQGRLADGGSPATGAYDFEFRLYDALTGGGQVGSAVTRDDVPVSNGLFTVELDFGAGAFTGEARYLQIGVRPGSSTGAYTTLSPRQALNPTPYALYSLSTGGLQGRPVSSNPPTSGQVLKWNGSAWAPAADKQSPYVRTVVVSPIGSEYVNGQALLDALNGITTASAANPWLLRIEPGTYNVGAGMLQMKEYVDIEGSGEGITIITGAGSAFRTGTIFGANNAELRFLTVQSTGGNNVAIAIHNDHASPRLTHVTAHATGGSVENTAVFNDHASPGMTHVTAVAVGSADSNYGVINFYSLSTMRHVTVRVGDGGINHGVYNDSSSLMGVEDLVITVGGGDNCYGVYNADSSLFIQGSRINVFGQYALGVLNRQVSTGGKVQIDNCKISAIADVIGYTIWNSLGYDTAVGATHLDGGPVHTCTGACPVTCAGVYDTGYTFYANTCP